MKIGAYTLATDYSVDVAVFARRAEELGFDSYWAGEQPFLPVTTDVRLPTPFPDTPEGVVPDIFADMVDPFVALARASAVTTRIKLGTGVCVLPERNPLLMAKQVATLDHYSGGRVIFGVGAGWIPEEAEIMGCDFPHRWTQAREAIEAMKELWTKEEAEYHGRYYDFPPVRCFPKPAQVPHPPIYLGGLAKNVFKRTVAWADGWMPSWSSPDEIRRGRETLNRLAAEAGRDPSTIDVLAYDATSDPEQLKALEEAGADQAVIQFPTLPEAEALAELERVASIVLPR